MSGVHRIGDAVSFTPEGHAGVAPVRLLGTDADDFLSVVLSSYEPGAHADLSPVPVDTVYVILTGTLTITYLDEKHELTHLDSISLPAGSVRAVDNFSTEKATMLVLRPTQ